MALVCTNTNHSSIWTFAWSMFFLVDSVLAGLIQQSSHKGAAHCFICPSAGSVEDPGEFSATVLVYPVHNWSLQLSHARFPNSCTPTCPLMTFLLMKGRYGRLPSSCISAPSSPHLPKGKPWGGIQQKALETQGDRECLRFNSTKLICQQNLITVIHSKSFIVLLRQAHPCPALFFYQNHFPWSHHLFPSAGWSQPLLVHLGRGRPHAWLWWVYGSSQNSGVKQRLITVVVFGAGSGAHVTLSFCLPSSQCWVIPEVSCHCSYKT